MHDRKEDRIVLKNTLFNMTAGLSVQALSVLSGIFVARTFGPAGYGDLSFAFVLVSYLMMGTDFGITAIAVRKVAQAREGYGKYLGTYLLSRLILSIAAYALMLLLVRYSGYGRPIQYLIMAYGLLIMTNIFAVLFVFNANQRMEYQGICDVSEKILYILFLISGYVIFRSIYVVPLSMALSSLIVVFLGWYFLRKNYGRIRLSYDKAFFRELVFESWPVGISNGASRVNSNIDTLFIQMYHGSILTGYYNAGYRIIGLVVMFGNFFTVALYPLLCEKAVAGADSMENVLNNTGNSLMMFVTFPACVLTIMGGEIVGAIFGSAYAPAGPAIAVLAWVPPLLLVSRLYGNALTAMNKQKYFMSLMIVSALINIALNFLLIPRYGMVGAGFATLITEVMIFFMAYHFLSKEFHLDFFRPLIKVAGASGATILGMVFLRQFGLIVCLGVSPVLYFGTLYCLGGITREQLEFIGSFARGVLASVKPAGRTV